jgi:hypothetical protein
VVLPDRIRSQVTTRPGGKRQLDDARLGQRVEIGARGDADIGRRRLPLGIARDRARARQLEAEQAVAQCRRRARARADLVGALVGHHPERQCAPGELRAEVVPAIGAVLGDLVRRAAEQGDPQAVVDRLGQIDARSAGHLDGLVERERIRRGLVVRGVEQGVIVAELLARRVDRPADIESRLERQHVERGRGAEGHAARKQLGAARDEQGVLGPAVVGEGCEPARLLRRRERQAEQLEELGAVALGDLVGAVEQALGDVREQLDQRHARIGIVEVGPFGRVRGDARDQFVDQSLVAAGVDRGGGQGHGPVLPQLARASGTSSETRCAVPVATRR